MHRSGVDLIFGIPCFVRSENFIKSILPEIGKVVNPYMISLKSSRLDVLNLMRYTDSLDPIRNRVKACVDEICFNLLIIEDVSLHREEMDESTERSNSSSKDEDYASSPVFFVNDDEPPQANFVLIPKSTPMQERSSQGRHDLNLRPPREHKHLSGSDVNVRSDFQKLEGDRSEKDKGLSTSIKCFDSFADNLKDLSGKVNNTDSISMNTCSRDLKIS